MSAVFSIDIKGAVELEKALRTLPDKARKKVYIQAIRKGAGKVRTKARSNARNMVGGTIGSELAKHIKTKAFSGRIVKRGVPGVSVMVGASGNDIFVVTGKGGKRNYIPSAIEYGHAAPGDARSGVKVAPAIPYMRSAWDNTKQQALSTIIAAMKQGIDREASK